MMDKDHKERTFTLSITVHGKPENLPNGKEFAQLVNELLGYRNLGEFWVDREKVKEVK